MLVLNQNCQILPRHPEKHDCRTSWLQWITIQENDVNSKSFPNHSIYSSGFKAPQERPWNKLGQLEKKKIPTRDLSDCFMDKLNSFNYTKQSGIKNKGHT